MSGPPLTNPQLSAAMSLNNLIPGYFGGQKPIDIFSRMAPVFPGMPASDLMMHPMFLGNHMRPLYSQAQLDNALYGYATPQNVSCALVSSLALSGLNIMGEAIERKRKKGNEFGFELRKAVTEYPEGVSVLRTHVAGVAHITVVSRGVIAKGRRFGPYLGKIVHASEIKNHDSNKHMWEIFKEESLEYFVDGRSKQPSWMSLVNCARYPQEQNLDAIQVGKEIYYEANKEIAAGKELLVWYGDAYQMYMGIPIGIKIEEGQGVIMKGLKQSLPDPGAVGNADGNGEGFACERCGKVFAYKYYKEKHLKYTRCVDQGDRKFPCTLCSRSFEKRDRLRIHVLHVHEKHRPHKCSVCGKCFSQSSSLNKHMRVHSGERPYKCVYCNKAFTASSILRTHIRQHSGEKPFKCKHCGKAFASHAAHDSHVRRTHRKTEAGIPSTVGQAGLLRKEDIDVVG